MHRDDLVAPDPTRRPDLGDVATVSLTAQPGGMTVLDGLLRWVPTNAQVGARAATLRATDLAGATADLSFTVTVANTNDPPRITSSPVTSATEDAAYAYAVTAADDDVGDSRIFSLTTAPVGMTIGGSTGLIAWTPTQEQVGMHPVVVVVTDAAIARVGSQLNDLRHVTQLALEAGERVRVLEAVTIPEGRHAGDSAGGTRASTTSPTTLVS
jgi:hypothetical protein